MRDLRRKFAIAVLAAGAVLGGLAVPATAAAADVDAVQITVCNDSDAPLRFWVRGYNQFNDWDDSPIWQVGPHSCATGWNYWWKKNASVELHRQLGDAAWTWNPQYVPRAADQTTTFHLS
jgi:uncharacterized membrane protein